MKWLTHANIILPDVVLEDYALGMNGNTIAELVPSSQVPSKSHDTIDLKGHYLAPGFIDLHIHGAMGMDTMNATQRSWNAISSFHAQGGTTSFLLTTVTAPRHHVLKVLELAKQRPRLAGAELLGIHVEGPFLAPSKRGAHTESLLREPTAKEYSWMLEYADVIKQITVAPELKGALPFIRKLSALGINASIGHSNADASCFEKAVKAGARQVTHCFNCTSSATKQGAFRQPGINECALTHEGVFIELIADGFHVHPTLLRMAYSCKGTEGIVLITDATCGAGLPLGSLFNVGDGIHGKVHQGHALTADGQTLAGSTIQMIDAVRFMSQEIGLPLPEVIRMASTNPAQRLHLQNHIGSIAPKMQADLVCFDRHFKVQYTWKKGRLVFQR